MNVVDASESSFSDSASVLREAGSWLLGENPAKGNQWVKQQAKMFICYSAQDGDNNTDKDPS